MPIEIERKFLVTGDSWRESCHRREKLIDGLIAAVDGKKVRVRLYDGKATLTIKGAREGTSRAEFEYEIPAADAREMVECFCDGRVLVKTRHYVACGAFEWQVDEYEGVFEGVVTAEVELDSEHAFVPLPEWAGREVTHDPAYRKINMLNARRGQPDGPDLDAFLLSRAQAAREDVEGG